MTEPTRGFMLDPGPHEVGAHLIYTSEGLTPYFALDAVGKAADGSTSSTFDFDGERWKATIYSTESGFEPRDDPDFRIETVREYNLHVKSVEDSIGSRKAHYNISPRWPDMETTDGKVVSTPDIEGVNATAQGANIPVDDYPDLLRAAADALDVNPEYFGRLNPMSNIFAFERYVRVDRAKAKRVIGPDSPMRGIFRYIDGDAKFRELREDDRNGVEGYHHRVRLDSVGSGALIPGHSMGRRIKHYHPEHPRSDPSDPLYHPKIGASLQTKLNTDGSVPWSERDALRRELDESLLNILSWAGLPVRPDGETYIEDGYWTPEDSAKELTLIDDPFGRLQNQQEKRVRAIPGDPDMTESDRETLDVLTDGGQERSVGELASEIDVSHRTVYRVVERLDGLLRVDGGTVAFASDFLAEATRGALRTAKRALEKDGQSGEGGPWAAFKARYAPEVEQLFPDAPADTIELRFGEVPSDSDMNEVLREGLRAWLRSGRDRTDFEAGQAHWIQDGNSHSTPALGGMDLGTIPEFSELKSIC